MTEGSKFFPMRESFLEPIGEEDVLSDVDCNFNDLQFSYPMKPKSNRAFMKQHGLKAYKYSRRRSKAKIDILEYAPATKQLLKELESASAPTTSNRAADLTPNLQGLLKELESALSPLEVVAPVQAPPEKAAVSSLKTETDLMKVCPLAINSPSEAPDIPVSPKKELSKQSSVIEPGNVGYIRLRYPMQEPRDYDPNSPEELMLVAGTRVHLQPHVDIISEKQRALEGHLSYAVEPPLPQGLTLDENSGLISGVPQESQAAASVHNICISIDATSKGGCPLGKLPLTSCPIVVEIANARDKKRKRATKPL
jgi:hypothetical protein